MAQESSSHDNQDTLISHHQLIESIDKTMKSLINDDPLLEHLNTDITTQECDDIIALEHGQAIKVCVNREDGNQICVVVNRNADVGQLKRAIQCKFNSHSLVCGKKKNKKTKINWRYIWNKYQLIFDGHKLTNDKEKIKDLGLSYNDCQLRFITKIN